MIIIVIISWIPGTVLHKITIFDPIKHKYVAYFPHKIGLFDAVRALFQGITARGAIVAFILAIGAYIYKILDSGALEAGIGVLLHKLRGKEIYLIPLCILFFGFGGTTYNMAEETIPFFPILIPVLMFAGFDVMTTILVITFGAGMGVIGATISPFSTVIAAGILNISILKGIVWRLLIFFVCMGFVISFTMWYAHRVRQNPHKSVLDYRASDLQKHFGHYKSLPKMTKQRKMILIVFIVVFVLMVLIELPWGTFFNVPPNKFGMFSPQTGGLSFVGYYLNKYFPYLTTSIYSSQDGGIFLDLAVLFFFATLVIAFLNWKGESQFVSDYILGAKELLIVGLIIAAAGGITVLLDNNHTGFGYAVGNAIASGVANMTAPQFIIVAFLAFVPLSFLIPSSSAFATAILPLFSKAAAHTGSQSGLITAYTTAGGFVNLFSPTGVPIACLTLAKISYRDFWKGTWFLIVAAFVIPLVLLPLGALLGSLHGAGFIF